MENTTPLVPLSPAEHKQFDQVQAILMSLEKATRALKLYSANNQILVQHRDHLVQLFSLYLKEHGELKLGVRQTSFFFLDRPIFQNENKKESFAYRLYNEGMRGLRFTEGLNAQELEDFMALLNMVSQEGGVVNSSSTMLWEKEFTNISYDIAQYVIEDEKYEVETKMEQILDPSMQQYKGATSPSFGPPEDIEETIDPQTLLPQNEFKKIARDICVLDAKEFEQIQREISHGEKHERLMMDLFDILLTLILEERNSEELGKLYQILLETIDSTVIHGELNITSQFLSSLRGMLDGGTGDFSMRHPDRINRIIDGLGTTDRINRYLNCLNLGFTGSVKDIVNFFGSLPKRAFPIMLQQIHVISSPQLRKEIGIAVSHLYDQDQEHFAKVFKTIKSPNHLLDVLMILSHTRDGRVISHMQPLFQNQNRSVRLAAINTLKDLESLAHGPLLMGLMEDEDQEVRLSAIKGLANCGDVSIGRLLMEKLQTPTFQEVDITEKRIYFHSTAKLLGDEMLPTLEKILANNPIFRKQHLDDSQQCAVNALGTIASEGALQMLRHFEEKGGKMVRHHCARELKRSHPT